MIAGELRQNAGAESTTNVVVARSVDSHVELGRVVIGYNHNLPYKGHVYHIQTEDSGRAKGRIFTHVFHSGIIVASNRVAYDAGTSAASIVELARKSHKSMMHKLVQGALDGEIARCSIGRVVLVSDPQQAPIAPANGPHSEDGTSDGHRRRIQALIEALDMEHVEHVLEDLCSSVAGTMGVALVDYESGLCLGTSGTGLDMDVAAAGIMEVMKVKARLIRALGIEGGIEDVLITLGSQIHLVRPVGAACFLYLVMERQQSSLALARHKLAAVDVKFQDYDESSDPIR